jgi:hypothetical protein
MKERGDFIMKKKMAAILAFVLIIAMQTATVFAAPSPTPETVDVSSSSGGGGEESGTDTPTATLSGNVSGPTLSGDVVMVSGEDSAFYVYRLTSVNGEITESRSATIGIQAVADEKLVTLTSDTLSLVRNKMFELEAEARNQNKDIDGIAFDVTAGKDITSVNFIDPRIEASDKDNGLLRVFHQKSDGTWEEPVFASYDGGVIVNFENGLSPVMIVKYTNSADYTNKATISGDATSPKTANGSNYAAVVAVVALACILLCTRKSVRK